jgi:RNA-binding protein
MTGKDRHYLRGLAHGLSPVVIVGQRGLTRAAVRQVDGALEDHELIKVRLGAECPVEREAAAAVFRADCGCDVAGAIGRVLILYRPHREQPRIRLPSATAS